MHAAEVVAFLAFAFIGCFTPGPNVAIAATTGVNHGMRAALPQVAGVPIGFVLMMWAVGMGGMAVLQGSQHLLLLMKIAGNAYLLYLAWKLCFSSKLSNAGTIKPLSVQQAAMFQIVNPKSWMTLVAATSTYAIGHDDFFLRMTWMSLGFATISAMSLVAWAWMGEKLRSWLSVGSRLRIFNLCMGISLALTAVWMFTL
ncbi:MAG: LysE family translocator [Pseudomonadota bacterium]